MSSGRKMMAETIWEAILKRLWSLHFIGQAPHFHPWYLQQQVFPPPILRGWFYNRASAGLRKRGCARKPAKMETGAAGKVLGATCFFACFTSVEAFCFGAAKIPEKTPVSPQQQKRALLLAGRFFSFYTGYIGKMLLIEFFYTGYIGTMHFFAVITLATCLFFKEATLATC